MRVRSGWAIPVAAAAAAVATAEAGLGPVVLAGAAALAAELAAALVAAGEITDSTQVFIEGEWMPSVVPALLFAKRPAYVCLRPPFGWPRRNTWCASPARLSSFLALLTIRFAAVADMEGWMSFGEELVQTRLELAQVHL